MAGQGERRPVPDFGTADRPDFVKRIENIAKGGGLVPEETYRPPRNRVKDSNGFTMDPVAGVLTKRTDGGMQVGMVDDKGVVRPMPEAVLAAISGEIAWSLETMGALNESEAEDSPYRQLYSRVEQLREERERSKPHTLLGNQYRRGVTGSGSTPRVQPGGRTTYAGRIGGL